MGPQALIYFAFHFEAGFAVVDRFEATNAASVLPYFIPLEDKAGISIV